MNTTRKTTSYRITVIPGDGIGPEVSQATLRVLEATGVDFQWEVAYAGLSALERFGTVLPPETMASLRRNKVGLKAPTSTPQGTASSNQMLRQGLDLYACLRPCKIYPGAPTRYETVDIVVVRENTEDIYCGVQFEKGSPQAAEILRLAGGRLREDSGFGIKAISQTASRRIARFAFEYAARKGRKKVTAVHRANALSYSDGIFLAAAQEMAREFPGIEFEDAIVDSFCMRLVRWPQEYDVLVLPNLYGDIVSDLCAGLVGGLGVAPGANLGQEIAMFEAAHGSAPKYAGLNKANPMALMLSGAMMLRHLGEEDAAQRLEEAIAAVIAEGKRVTYDLKPRRDDPTAVGTSQVADAVIEKIRG